MSKRNALIGAVLVVIAVVALIVLSGGEDDNDKVTDNGNAAGIEVGAGDNAGKDGNPVKKKPPVTNPPVPTIVIGSDGKPEGGVAELVVDKGETVRFKVESAVADHVHVHGYDLMKDLEPGATVSFEFPASIEGIFEAELEDRAEQILELRVEP
jgi:hypothetical protein